MKSVFFTDRKRVSDFKKLIRNLPKNSTVIIREYDLSANEREAFARKILNLSRAQGFRVLVGKDLSLARKIKADGVHFSDFDKIPIQVLQHKNFFLSLACHSLKSFLKAKKLKPDMIFISPIFPTQSHKSTIFGTKSLGLCYLAKIIKISKDSLPIYALGGVNSTNIKSLQKLGISGFGAINFFQQNS